MEERAVLELGLEFEATQGRLDALLHRLYWRSPVEVEPGVFEHSPRRFAFLIRPLIVGRSRE